MPSIVPVTVTFAPLPDASVFQVMLFVSTTGPVIEMAPLPGTAPRPVVMSAAVVS